MKSVQGDSGHAQVKMVADVYSHIIDDDRRLNAERLEAAFYSGRQATPEPVQPVTQESSTDDKELLLKLLQNPEMAALLKSLWIPSLRQTYQRIQDTNSYRWFLGYGLLDTIPHFATVSYAFCKRFPDELTTEIFEHILNKALNNRMLDPSAVFIDGTHIKASANKKKFQKEQVVDCKINQ